MIIDYGIASNLTKRELFALVLAHGYMGQKQEKLYDGTTIVWRDLPLPVAQFVANADRLLAALAEIKPEDNT